MKILIGYDGSEYSDFAIEDLQKAGLPAQAEAVVLTVGEAWDLPLVVDRVSAGVEKFVYPTTRLIETHLAEVSERSRRLAEDGALKLKGGFPDWDISAEGVCGKPALELIKKADELLPDLIVLGSQGRSAIGRALLGSVSHKVLHESNCSVRIARKNTYGDNPNPRILVGTDGSPNAEAVIRAIAGRKWATGTECRLIAVDDFAQAAAVSILWNLEENKPIDNEESRAWIAKIIDAPAEILRSVGLQVSYNIRWGDAAGMILKEAEEWKADSIFVGARGLGRLKRFLLGSVSSAVAARAKCSVEVVRPESSK